MPPTHTLPKTIYCIHNYGSPDSNTTYMSFLPPDNDTNPDALPVVELDAADAICDEAHYYSTHGKCIDISHKQLIELMAELYQV